MAETGGGWLKIPQIGRVVIGDRVDIGANTTIDRGALDDTVIESDAKLDNQFRSDTTFASGRAPRLPGAWASPVACASERTVKSAALR
jgi:hypothetical protein